MLYFYSLFYIFREPEQLYSLTVETLPFPFEFVRFLPITVVDHTIARGPK